MNEKKRMAKCSYFGGKTKQMEKFACCGCEKCKEQFKGDSVTGVCRCVTESTPSLAFFKAMPEEEFDSYYCGCMGWE
jgi:hypothetical protein